jgi:beta-glucosidase-like glycosyl hydrolase
MDAIRDRWSPDEAAVLAVNAGADIVLDAFNAPHQRPACPAQAMREGIERALSEGRIEGGEARVLASSRRVAQSG